MIYRTLQGHSLNTDQELTSPQRHVLQKLLTWEHLGLAPADFAVRQAQARQQGWGSLGPMASSPAFEALAQDLATRLAMRHGLAQRPGWLAGQAWPGRYAGGGLEHLEVAEGRLELLVRDAADLERGRLWLALDPGQKPAVALHTALTDLQRGSGPLAASLSALGLSSHFLS